MTIGRRMCITIGLRTCGTAMPLPNAVEPSDSRASSTWSRNWPVNLLGQGHDLDQRLEHGKLVGSAEPIVDAARLEGFRQTHDRAAAVRLGKDVGRDVQPLRSRPFEQFRPIEAILLVDPIRRQPALLDPAVDRFFGYFEQLSRIADTQIHPSCSVAAVLVFGQMMTRRQSIATLVQRDKSIFCVTCLPRFCPYNRSVAGAVVSPTLAPRKV